MSTAAAPAAVQPTAQLARCSFSRDSDDTLGTFSGYVFVRFWPENRWCFNVSGGVRQAAATATRSQQQQHQQQFNPPRSLQNVHFLGIQTTR